MAAGFLVLAGCAASGSVPWQDYTPTLQSRIDGLATAKDCAGLQAEFETADAANVATRTRTGHNNAALMGYIDDAEKRAGC